MDAAQPPRHLLRRFFAYAIDVALAWLIAFLGMALVLDDPILGKLDRETQFYSLGAGLQSGSFAPRQSMSPRAPAAILSTCCPRCGIMSPPQQSPRPRLALNARTACLWAAMPR
ncbi:MAG: hypothetical protein HC783_08000 [Rhodobacteraceae bacterium]|nr:hypothetical protein [Paracoccaceae bacterium]